MSFIEPTNEKFVTLYDVSIAINEHTDKYDKEDIQYAVKSFIVSNYDNVYLDKLNTSDNSIRKPYQNDQFVKWVDLCRVEYFLYIDNIGNVNENITEKYYDNTLTFTVYSYKTLYRRGNIVEEKIPVNWHYTSDETKWTTNSPTSGSSSATTITLRISENTSRNSRTFVWSAIQEEKGNLPYKEASITITQNPKYGTVKWVNTSTININSITTSASKGIVVTDDFNDGQSDSQGSDLQNILTAITISSNQSWVTAISYNLNNSSYTITKNTSESSSRRATITMTINDPRLVLIGGPSFDILQNMRIVTHGSYNLYIISDGRNSFGSFSCYGGNKSYTVHSYASEYYDGEYQFQVNIPYTFNDLSWASLTNSFMKPYRSVYSSSEGSGSGSINVDESPIEGQDRSGNITFSQNPYNNSSINASVYQSEPCMIYTFNISPTSKNISGTNDGSFDVSVTSYKVKNGHTESPIPVGYDAECSEDWVTVSGNTSTSSPTTSNNVKYTQNESDSRNATIIYTQNERNEYGNYYSKNLELTQTEGFVYVYKFYVNNTAGSSMSPTITLPSFSFTGGTQSVSVKSYAEVRIGTESGAIDHYIAVPWSSTSCDWTTVNPSSGSGVSSTSNSETSRITADAQSESSSDNSRCCNIIYSQNDSGYKVTVKACQDDYQTGYTYTFSANTTDLTFEACSESSKNVTIYSYRDKIVNGGISYGDRVNLGYDVSYSSWVTATDNQSPSSISSNSTITAESNSNNSQNRTLQITYTQKESNKTIIITINQDGATCATYGIGQLKVDIGSGMTTSATKNVTSGQTSFDVSFESPQYRSLCGVSSNTKCETLVEPFYVKSKSDWISSEIGSTATTSNDTVTVNLNNTLYQRNGSIVYTNGSYDATINITQEEGLNYVYKFIVNGTEGSYSQPQSNLSEFKYSGGTQTIQIKSYVEVWNGVTAIDHYEAVPWSCTTCNWITPSMSSGSGVSSTASTESNTLTASAQAEASSDNTRCCDMIFTQGSSGYKVKVHVCQEECISGYTYTFSTNVSSLDFEACSSSSKTALITSYKDKTVNGNIVSGARVNVGYTCTNLAWATGTTTSSPSATATTTTITVSSNSNNTLENFGTLKYTQAESGKLVNISLHQDAATCATYAIGQLKLDVGDGMTTSASKNVPMSASTFDVSFESPQYRSLCGISSNTKCDTLVEPYKIKSIPDWLTSKIGTVESTSTDTISVSQNSSTEGRTGSIVYTNGTYDASINVIQEQGISRIYKFIVNGVTGTTSSPQSNLSEFKYSGGTQTIQIKSYVEIQNGGVFDHYEAVPWSCTTCNWITPSMSSGSGVSSTASTESNTLTASAQSESSTDNTRCCDMIFTQGSSGYKVVIHVCQEECISGYSYQVAWNPEVLEFDPCSESSIDVKLTSSKQKWVNGVDVGEPIPVELSCTNLSWASGSTVPSPTSVTNTYTITVASNAGNSSYRDGELTYTMVGIPLPKKIDISIHQDAGTGCSKYIFSINGFESESVPPAYVEYPQVLTYGEDTDMIELAIESKFITTEGTVEPKEWGAILIDKTSGSPDPIFTEHESGGTQTATIKLNKNASGTDYEYRLAYMQLESTYGIYVNIVQPSSQQVNSVIWSSPSENTTVEVENYQQKLTAYADTTGATYNDCSLVISDGWVTHGEIQGTGSDGKRSVWVELTISSNFDENDKSATVTISC